MCHHRNISHHNGVICVQRCPTLLRQLAEHLVSKHQAKKALARSSLVETSPANQYLFEREMPLAGGQRVISGMPQQSRWEEEKERDDLHFAKDAWEKESYFELPLYRS